jgi:cytochrome c oxidase subunit III
LHDNAHAVAQQGLRHHFADMEQQRASATLGMWVFLVTEIMFFGGLFCAYLVYRTAHMEAFEYGSFRFMEFGLGTLNTVVLLCSSLMVALGVHAIQMGRQKLCAILFTCAALCGFGFLGIKGIEYHNHWVDATVPGLHWAPQKAVEEKHLPPMHDENGLEMFFYIYFVMTGLHAIHVTIGIGVLLVIAWLAWHGHYTTEYHSPVHVSGLYWHFVDVVWIFLYPLLYLISGKGA